MNRRVLAYRNKARDRLDAVISKKYPGCPNDHHYEIGRLFDEASSRFGVNRRARLVRQLIRRSHAYNIQGPGGPIRLDQAISQLADCAADTDACMLSLANVALKVKKTETGRYSYYAETKTVPNLGSDPYTPSGKDVPVYNTQIYYSSETIVRLKIRRSVKALLALSLACGLAYLAGYPPPQRFLLPSQKTASSRFKDACRGNDVLKLSGHLHEAKEPHLGDSLLSASQRESREKTLCAEKLYRRYGGDFSAFKRDNLQRFR